MRLNLIAKIHIAKKQLGLDEDVYRDVLSHVTNGKTSCSKMTETELEKVLSHFYKKGFKAKAPANKRRMSPPSSEPVKTPQIRKIRAIWITMYQHGIVRDNSEAALNAYVVRMTGKFNKGKGIESVAWLTPIAAETVLEALKLWHKREIMQRLVAAGIVRDGEGKPIYKRGYDYVICRFEEAKNEGVL
jgi:phage gp16-like protein